MKYTIYVLTPEFKAKVNAWLDSKTGHLPDYVKEKQTANMLSHVQSYWRGDLKWSTHSKLYKSQLELERAMDKYYGPIASPDYVCLCVQVEHNGRDRTLMWNGERISLNDVPDIYHFRLSNGNSPLTVISKRLNGAFPNTRGGKDR